MHISQYTVSQDSIQRLSNAQVQKFFENHKPITQQDCDDTAANIVGGQVRPTTVQGVTSYTVLAGNQKAVQFRAPDSPLDVDLLDYARATYGRFVPGCQSFGLLGQLHVYVMDSVPGVALSIARCQLYRSQNYSLLTQGVQDFATSVDSMSPSHRPLY